MTQKEKAKEKAIEITDKFSCIENNFNNYEYDKECASIVVDEVMNVFVNSTPNDDPYLYLTNLEFWNQVKEEIENL